MNCVCGLSVVRGVADGNSLIAVNLKPYFFNWNVTFKMLEGAVPSLRVQLCGIDQRSVYVKNHSLEHGPYAAFFDGTLAPSLRAFDRPMAMACLRLLTFPPLPPGPLRALPRLYSCIYFSTSFEPLCLYFIGLLLFAL